MQSQVVMDFFTVQGEGRRAVERLNPYRPEHLRADGLTLDERAKGQAYPVSYNEWLRFYSPLSERGSI